MSIDTVSKNSDRFKQQGQTVQYAFMKPSSIRMKIVMIFQIFYASEGMANRPVSLMTGQT